MWRPKSALGVGTLVMFAARRALTNPVRLQAVLDTLMAAGDLTPGDLDPGAPLGFLGDVRDAAYRFCAHEPGAAPVLRGTGSVERSGRVRVLSVERRAVRSRIRR